MTTIMLRGGKRDGELLEVPGPVLEPDTKYITFQVPVKSMYDAGEGVDEAIAIRTRKMDILPREADTGPLWYVDVPKELW